MPDSLSFSAPPKEPVLLDEAGARALVASYAPVSVTAAVKDIALETSRSLIEDMRAGRIAAC